MSAAGKLRFAYLAYISRPSEDRWLYRLVKNRRVRSVLELGIGSVERTLRLISVAQRYSPDKTIRYTALDWFEERPAHQPRLSLIDAHRVLKGAGAEARLMPGGPSAALPAVANSLMGTDLVLIAPTVEEDTLASGWFYMPRILHADSVVSWQVTPADGRPQWRQYDHAEVDRLAGEARMARAA